MFPCQPFSEYPAHPTALPRVHRAHALCHETWPHQQEHDRQFHQPKLSESQSIQCCGEVQINGEEGMEESRDE